MSGSQAKVNLRTLNQTSALRLWKRFDGFIESDWRRMAEGGCAVCGKQVEEYWIDHQDEQPKALICDECWSAVRRARVLDRRVIEYVLG